MQPALCPVHSTQSPHLSYERCCCKTPNFPRYRSGVPVEKGAGFHHLVKDNRGFQNASGSFPLHRSCWSWGEQQSPSRHSPHRPLHLLAISPSWETPCHLQHASKSPAQRLWLAHQPPAFPPKGSPQLSWMKLEALLCRPKVIAHPLSRHLCAHVLLALHPTHTAPVPADVQGPWGHFIFLHILPQGGTDAWVTVEHGPAS